MSKGNAKRYYEVLGVAPTSSHEEVKKAYQQLVLKVHPDKVSRELPAEEQSKAEEEFLAVDEAWKVLGDSEQRQKYDKGIREQKLVQEWPVNAEVDLDDMEESSDNSYSWPCRCGGEYVITHDNLENGKCIVCCSICTLSIRVMYAVVSDTEDEKQDS